MRFERRLCRNGDSLALTLPFKLVKHLNLTAQHFVALEEKHGEVTLSFIKIPHNNDTTENYNAVENTDTNSVNNNI